jgi:dTDP-4-dehydrorhamnose reductase
MNILVLGAQGQLGFELCRSLMPLGQVTGLTRNEADLADLAGFNAALEAHPFDVVVNAAAYTAVDKAETETELAHTINGTAVGLLGEVAAQRGALVIHYSTDYVFDGTKPTPYLETDPTGPLNAYGQSKRAGEMALQESGADHLIFRTTWVYGARGANFFRTMLRVGKERETLSVVADQLGAPTFTRNLADMSAHVVVQAMRERYGRTGAHGTVPFQNGLYHLCNEGKTSWHGFATAIFEAARAKGLPMNVSEVKAITTDQYPLPARRPAYSHLDMSAFKARFGLAMPTWEDGLWACMDDYATLALA